MSLKFGFSWTFGFFRISLIVFHSEFQSLEWSSINASVALSASSQVGWGMMLEKPYTQRSIILLKPTLFPPAERVMRSTVSSLVNFWLLVTSSQVAPEHA